MSAQRIKISELQESGWQIFQRLDGKVSLTRRIVDLEYNFITPAFEEVHVLPDGEVVDGGITF